MIKDQITDEQIIQKLINLRKRGEENALYELKMESEPVHQQPGYEYPFTGKVAEVLIAEGLISEDRLVDKQVRNLAAKHIILGERLCELSIRVEQS